jgi:hypothetical protein
MRDAAKEETTMPLFQVVRKITCGELIVRVTAWSKNGNAAGKRNILPALVFAGEGNKNRLSGLGHPTSKKKDD